MAEVVIVRVGVFSDTHSGYSAQGARFFGTICERYLADAPIVLHAGDIVDPDLLTLFAPRQVFAVRGNLDPPGHPRKRIVPIEGVKIGLIHGWGSVHGLEDRVLAEFDDEGIDCLVYGHSHLPTCRRRNGILLFNPGSPTDRRSAPFHSIGILTIDGSVIDGEIIPIPGPSLESER